jgi:hypothetical protein
MMPSVRRSRPLLSGAAAGAVSAFLFTALHHLVISDIWATLPLMMAAGALCGVCVAWSFSRLFPAPTQASWIGYNLFYVALLVLLGVASIVVFEPVTTAAALLAADEPPRELMRMATPLTVAFILASTALIWWLWGRNLVDVAAILLTCAVLLVLVGTNVAILGLVHIPMGTVPLVAKFFGLVLALDAGYVGAFLALERQQFRQAERLPEAEHIPPVVASAADG